MREKFTHFIMNFTLNDAVSFVHARLSQMLISCSNFSTDVQFSLSCIHLESDVLAFSNHDASEALKGYSEFCLNTAHFILRNQVSWSYEIESSLHKMATAIFQTVWFKYCWVLWFSWLPVGTFQNRNVLATHKQDKQCWTQSALIFSSLVGHFRFSHHVEVRGDIREAEQWKKSSYRQVIILYNQQIDWILI